MRKSEGHRSESRSKATTLDMSKVALMAGLQVAVAGRGASLQEKMLHAARMG